MRDYLSEVKELVNEGFETKAAQKRCIEKLSRAYNFVTDDIREMICDLYVRDAHGVLVQSPRNDELHDLYWAIPTDLHNYREKHTKALLAASTEFKLLTDKVEALFALRKGVLAMEITPKKTKAELLLEESRNLKTPVALAVRPLREEAIKQAKQMAKDRIEAVHKLLDAAGWNKSNVKTKDVQTCLLLTQASQGGALKPCPHSEERFIEMCADMAASQYDQYIYKLNEKVGPHKAASLEGNHVWGDSYLTVETETGEIDVWHTQMILNHSKHGLAFNQFPTRKIKAAK